MEFAGWLGISGLMLMIASNKTPYVISLIEGGKEEKHFSQIQGVTKGFHRMEMGRQLAPSMAGATEMICGVDRCGFVGIGADELSRWDRSEAVSVGDFRNRIHLPQSDHRTTEGLVLNPQGDQTAYATWTFAHL